MTHNEARASWLKEGAIGLGVGILYGTSNVAVGHPIDTVKTKMQAQVGFEKTNSFQTLYKTLRTQGIVGLYRGCVPPLWGSGIYRSTQFAVFEACYTYMNKYQQPIPLMQGMQVRVVLSGIIASTSRAIIECPLEFAKTRRQTQQSWDIKKVYTGFPVVLARTIGLMTSYFMMVDHIRRNHPKIFNYPLLGPFITSGFSATFGWWIVWPLEVVKTQVQSGYVDKNVSTIQQLKRTFRDKGVVGMYRGIGPGTARSFLANGSAMIVMQFAQRKVSEWGLRK